MSEDKAERRRGRFHSRIKIEREILTIVNSSDFGREFPLAGMTSHAIAEWETRSQRSIGTGGIALIANLLLEIGKKTELLADDSRDVFGSHGVSSEGSVERLKSELHHAVTMMMSREDVEVR